MAIDTAAKRNSAMDHEEVWQFAAPLPDGAIGQGDRQHSIWSYSGILATAAIIIPGIQFTPQYEHLHFTPPRNEDELTAQRQN